MSYLLGLGPSLEKLLFFLGFVTRPTGSSSESSSKKGSSSSSFLAAVRFSGFLGRHGDLVIAALQCEGCAVQPSAVGRVSVEMPWVSPSQRGKQHALQGA